MALRKRNNIWWIDIMHQGQRIRKSTGTNNKVNAQRFHDQFKSDLWRFDKLNLKPEKCWQDAVVRWLSEANHKRSLDDDKLHLRWLDPFLKDKLLNEIDSELIEEIAKQKEATGVKPTTVNRMLEILRAILRKAMLQWNWLRDIPTIRMRKCENRRIRWLKRNEANTLLSNLPDHLRDMAEFTLATGLRMSNVTGLMWQDLNLVKKHAWVHPDKSKTKRAIAIPLNSKAIQIIKNQLGKNDQFVFTYRGKPVKDCNTAAWKKALKRANIKDFRWHDLRHTWASWHVQSGTTLQELQQLGGWTNFSMVLRYAHLSSDHLKEASERICVTKLSQPPLAVIKGGR